ncbi:AsnC family transcriptional regulator [Desulfosarcina sp. OttesenSCG-928-A07]|nr:AsnC family transcriptional regulator [Desulfosarcina sp. OttesenSCG-928-G17]MDL2328911.1 AsnC family transcriptional regulator [Desulfosarcina sp. OttesenSCG-928-A07]
MEKKTVLDDRDKALLNRVQTRFPLSPRPFAVIGEEVGMDEETVISRLVALKEKGIIRRIGGNFVPDKVGFISTLCAAKVPPERMDLFARTVNAYPGVTHNYLRDNPYNVWFTFIAPSMAMITAHLADISKATGVTAILNLPATRTFKIKAKFDV